MNLGKTELRAYYANKLKSPFWLNIVNFSQQFFKFDIYVKRLLKLVFDFGVFSQKCLKV